MDLVTDIQKALTKLENCLKCSICKGQCKKPVRIKTCGHYFCSECLKQLEHNHKCPKCNEYFEKRHLDYENLAITSEKQLGVLKSILQSVENKNISIPNDKPEIAENNKSPFAKHTFIHNNNGYHVNYIKSAIKTNAKGETPLHLACKKKKLNEVKALIEAKVDINAKDYAGWAPLHEAIQSQCLEIVEYLLQNKCLVNIPGSEYVTPLHQAASLNSVGMVKLLLKYGADKNMVDYTGLKPEDSTKNQKIKDVLNSHSKFCSQLKIFDVFLPDKVVMYCHTIDDSVKDKLKKCDNIKVLDKLDSSKKPTHFMIKKTHKLSFKILQAMLDGLQFLTDENTDDYISGHYFIEIPCFTFLTKNATLNTGIQRSMISSLLKLPKLFDGLNFHIEGHVKPVDVYHLQVNKDYLAKLIKYGGGKVLSRPPATRTCETEFVHPFFAPEGSGTYRCCNFIIYAENDPPDLLYKMNELKHKSSKWLIDCICKYEISD